MEGPGLELWNTHENIPLYVGAQRIVNILGKVTGPVLPENLAYSLNDGPFRPVYVKRQHDEAPRLINIGDFNIDTLTADSFRPTNTLALKAQYADGTHFSQSVSFPAVNRLTDRHSLKMRLQEARYPEQVGQIVDGGWTVSTDQQGEKCLEIVEDRAGYDRIILLNEPIAGPNYTIRARLCVTDWLRSLHHAGLIFQWNPHLQGDGTTLPDQWSTGLAHYHSGSKGLRFRVGADVHFDEQGIKIGGQNFAQATLNPWRSQWSRILRKARIRTSDLPQLKCGIDYSFELKVRSRAHQLTVWRSDRAQPKAQIMIPDLPELLSGKISGVIVHYGTARIYDFEVEEET